MIEERFFVFAETGLVYIYKNHKYLWVYTNVVSNI